MSAIALLAALCLPCQVDVADAPSAAPEGWTVEVAASLGEKLGAVAMGDVDPSHPGDELVTVSVSGTVTVLHRDEAGAWQAVVAARLPGEMIQCAVGELRPDRPGDEIAVVGMALGTEESGGEGAAHVLSLHDGRWEVEEVLRAPELLHCVALASLDSDPGLELLVAGFDLTATALAWRDGAWVVHDSIDLPGAAKHATPWLGGLAIACRDGSVVKLRGTRRGLVTHEVLGVGVGKARIASDMTRLLVAGDDGSLTLVEGPGYPISSGVVYQAFDKLRGAVIADVDARSFGDELCTAGYDGQVVVLAPGREPLVVADDGERLHHLTSGELDGQVVLATCGYSGRVLIVRGPRSRRR